VVAVSFKKLHVVDALGREVEVVEGSLRLEALLQELGTAHDGLRLLLEEVEELDFAGDERHAA